MASCHICSGKIKKSHGFVVADTYKNLLDGLLKKHGADVEALCTGADSQVVNAITMQYFQQFDLFHNERRDMTLQMSWVNHPPQRFGIVFPRIPDGSCLFVLAHNACLDAGRPHFLIDLGKLAKPRQAVELTAFLSKQDWFNRRGWFHLCTDLFGASKADDIESRSLLA